MLGPGCYFHEYVQFVKMNLAIHLQYVHISDLEAKNVCTKTEYRNIGTL